MGKRTDKFRTWLYNHKKIDFIFCFFQPIFYTGLFVYNYLFTYDGKQPEVILVSTLAIAVFTMVGCVLWKFGRCFHQKRLTEYM